MAQGLPVQVVDSCGRQLELESNSKSSSDVSGHHVSSRRSLKKLALPVAARESFPGLFLNAGCVQRCCPDVVAPGQHDSLFVSNFIMNSSLLLLLSNPFP